MGYEVFDRLCKIRGVTAYQVAKETGVSTATLSSWKTGRYVPKGEKLQKLAEYFNVTAHYLATGEEDERQSIGLSRDELWLIGIWRDTDEANRELIRRMLKYWKGVDETK